MELHQYFMSIAVTEFPTFEIIGKTSTLRDCIGFVENKFIEDCFESLKDDIDTKQKYLELLRLLLCKQYKLNYEDSNDIIRCYTQINHFTECLIHSKLCRKKENQSILYDIVVLQLVLLQDRSNFIKLFENFQSDKISIQSQTDNDALTNWYLKILKCFLNAWDLYYFLNKDKKDFHTLNITFLECYKDVLLSSIVNDLKSWIRCKESHEWHALHSVLSKLIDIAKNTAILSPYIHEILDKKCALTILCVLCNCIFPNNCLNVDIDYSLIYSDKLWSMIKSNLLSPNSCNRKQALHLLQKLIDFINLNEQNIINSSPNSTVFNARPFICDRTKTLQLSIKQIRTEFILIIEVLEEKQKHLVIPSLPFIDNLIQGYFEHKSCGNCFDYSWIHCIFARILMHNNNAVIKWGLLKLLRLDTEIYNYDEFILLIVKALNNTFLYEKYGHETEPNIVTALTSWFNHYQSENLHLVEKFICFLHGVSWGPVPIYYILRSLFLTSDKLEFIVKLQQEQIDVIKLIMETNINLHPSMLRSMSQIMLIKILFRFSKIHNLMILSQLLTVFSLKDLKEPSCWPSLISWLAKTPYANVVSFISEVCDKLIVNDENVQIPMCTFALVIQLLYEGGIICQTEQCIAIQKLTKLLFYLDKITVRPYVKVSLTIKIIDFLYNLFDLQNIQFPALIYKLFINYKDRLFRFILTLFHKDDFDYKDIKICMKVLHFIITSSTNDDLEQKCIQIVSNINEHNETRLLFALQLWSNISRYYNYNDNLFLERICNLLKICKSKNYKNKLTGKMALDYYVALSKLIKNHVITLSIRNLKQNDNWLQIISSILDAAGNQVLIYFVDILHYFIINTLNNETKLENLKSLIKSFWNCNFNSKRDKVFWIVAEKLNKCLNRSEFLSCESVKDVSQEYTDRMLSEGNSLPGLKYIVLSSSEISKYFKYFMEAILNGLLHGQIMRRDQRIYMQTCMIGKQTLNSYALKIGKIDSFEAYDFLNRQCNVDVMIRAAAVVQLSHALHNNSENASFFLPIVIKKLLSVEKKRYFANSQLHKLKHRLLQIILMLEPYLNKKCLESLYNILCDSIIQDSDQHSVRLMKEWLLIRIYLSNQNLLSTLWIFFDKICNERPSSINSIIGIIWHVSQQLSKEALIKFIKIALPKLGICCMKQQFGVRLFGQIFFIKLYKLLDEDSDICIEYLSLYKAISESLQCVNYQKNSIQIDENFFYTIFNPIQHYTLETIYYHLPRLSNVSIEEWISKENFKDQIFLNMAVNIKMSNDDNRLDQAIIPYSFQKSSENTKPEEIECSQITTDIQKKIIPWKITSPNDKELTHMDNLSDLKNKIKNKQKMIIVASLVDKSQNLGGIARTCEIFGAKELVISNLKQIEDKAFQTLSVSSDKWLKIIEVKSFLLDKYLMEMKDCDWTLIGAEQTINSVNLINFKFPNQTVLVLGNEKNGIPANILPLLDVCIEIPQFGITRSLNVHVTSAICFWEYIKQHQIQY